MKKGLVRGFILAAAIATVGTLWAACDSISWRTEDTYDKNTDVPYYVGNMEQFQYGTFTAPPAIKMWWEYYAGGSWSLEDIANDLVARGASGFNYGADETPGWMFVEKSREHIGINPYWAVYPRFGTCNGGRACGDQAVADIHNALEANQPPAVVMFDHYYAIVKEYGRSRQCKFNNGVLVGCQPEFDWLKVHLPVVGGGPSYYVTTGDFVADLGDPLVVFFSDQSWFMSFGGADWAEFDAQAATYYGDPNPPEPTWDGSGCSDCGDPNHDPWIPDAIRLTPKSERLTTNVTVTRPLGRFVPNPSSRGDVITDFVVGVKRTHLNQQPELGPLTLQDGTLGVRAIVKVRSVGDYPDYFIVQLESRSTNRLYAQATVTASGMLGSVKLEDGDGTALPVQSAADARERASMFGITMQTEPEAIFGFGPIGLTQFNPLFMLTDTTGRPIIVVPDGRVFALTAQGKNLRPAPGETSLRGKQGEQLILRQLRRLR